MYDEWKETAHAKADDSPVFSAMQKLAGAVGCSRCHAPLELLNEPGDFAAREAVTCEVCHRIQSVDAKGNVPALDLLRPHEVKLGPRCDVDEPYFHRARCSPLFESPELCAACHHLYQPLGDGGAPLPVHTEYAEFKASRYAARGKTCQSCHMPGVRAELATAERERDDVPDHGFLGHSGKLRGTSLKASAVVTWTAETASLRFSLTNARAGHAIPAGSPGRQLVVTVVARNEGGAELSRKEHAFERRLVDANGEPAPFFLATRVGADTRILPGETRRAVVEFEQPGIASLDVSVAFRNLDPVLAKRMGVAESRLAALFEVPIPLGPSARGSRSVALRP
jgi:hypothetical protein